MADPSGSWEPSTAEAYIDQQVGTINTNLASETIARQTGDSNLSTQLQSEMATRADQDANLNALINAGIREGGGVQFDIVPTQNSANGITSGGMYSTLKDSNIGFVDETPTAGSNNLVKSGGIYNAVNTVVTSGQLCTDNVYINAIFPYIVATNEVKKIRVTMYRDNTNMNLVAYNANGEEILNRYFDVGVEAIPEVFNMRITSKTTLHDVLLRFNKNAFLRLRTSIINSQDDRRVFYGSFTEQVYEYQSKASLFNNFKQMRDWGGIDAGNKSIVGANIYGTCDCFRFPVKITSITIPIEKDGILEIYRTKIRDGVDAETVLLSTINAKKGTYKYPVDIDLNAGEGIGFCGNRLFSFIEDTNWRITRYNISTLKRIDPVTGFANGYINCSVDYYYLTDKKISPLKDIKISVLGDSISTFGTEYSYSNPYYPSLDIKNAYETWWGRLMQDGAIILKNMSVSQSTYINRTGDDEHRWIGYDARITNLNGDNDEVPDVILLLCGINDLFTNSTLGDFDFTKKITDFSELNTFSFKQALQYVVMRLIELYPSSKIILGTPFKVGNSDWNFPEQNGVRYLYQICEAIREIARIMGVGLIDFYSEVQISYTEMKNLKYDNNIHPNKLGHYLYYQITKRHLLDMNYQNVE